MQYILGQKVFQIIKTRSNGAYLTHQTRRQKHVQKSSLSVQATCGKPYLETNFGKSCIWIQILACQLLIRWEVTRRKIVHILFFSAGRVGLWAEWNCNPGLKFLIPAFYYHANARRICLLGHLVGNDLAVSNPENAEYHFSSEYVNSTPF